MRLFVHREPYGRFVSCLVFVPRDRYTTPVRVRIADVLVDAFGATSYEWNTRLSGVGARPPALRVARRPDAALDRAVDVARAGSARRGRGPGVGRRPPRRARARRTAKKTGLDLLRVWSATRSRPRTRTTSPRPRPLADLPQLAALDADDAPPLAARLAGGADHLDLKLYGLGAQPSLSEVLPRLTNMGVIVDDEHPVRRSRPRGLAAALDQAVPAARARRHDHRPGALRLFEDAFLAVSTGDAEDDGFNRLVLLAGPRVARGRAAARVQPLPAPGRHAVQPDLHRRRAGRAPRDRAPARRAVRARASIP